MRTEPSGGVRRVAARRGGLAFCWWLPILAYSGFIYYYSSGPMPVELPTRMPHMDKVLHFGAYGVWALLCAWPVRRFWPRQGFVAFVLTVGTAGALYGASDELHQSFVPGRECDAADLAADALGAYGGALGWWLVVRPLVGRSGPSGGRSSGRDHESRPN